VKFSKSLKLRAFTSNAIVKTVPAIADLASISIVENFAPTTSPPWLRLGVQVDWRFPDMQSPGSSGSNGAASGPLAGQYAGRTVGYESAAREISVAV
jgi:hypothetical protein